MGLSPWYTTQTSPAWPISLVTDSGTANLTGISASAISMIFTDTSTGIETTGTGTITIIQANPATITYQPSAADVANPATRHVRCWVTFTNGPEPFDIGPWEILQK